MPSDFSEAVSYISFAPLGLILNFLALPTAYAVGCILPPLRGFALARMNGGASRLNVIQRWQRCIVVCRLELNPKCGDLRKGAE